LEELNEFLKDPCPECIDPTMGTAIRFGILEQCLKSKRFGIPGGREFRTAKKTLRTFLLKARKLNRAGFWDSLETPFLSPDEVPFPSSDERRRKIDEVLNQVQLDDFDEQDFRSAMDALHDVIKSMCAQFSQGSMPDGFEGCSEELRYWAAANLRVLADGLVKLWGPIRQAAAEADGNDSIGEDRRPATTDSTSCCKPGRSGGRGPRSWPKRVSRSVQ
jgi:hypothetical protein